MSIEGQGHFFTIYFPGFACFVLYLDKISGERLQDHWSSGRDFSVKSKVIISLFQTVRLALSIFTVCKFIFITNKISLISFNLISIS